MNFGRNLAGSNSRGSQITVQMSSSKRSTPTKFFSKVGYPANDAEPEQEGNGHGKLYAPPNKVVAAAGMKKIDTQLEEGTGQGRPYSLHGTVIQIENGALSSKEHSVHSKTQITGKREEEDDEEEGSAQGKLYSPGIALRARLQTNGKNSRTDHSQLWNKGKGVLEASKGVAGDIRRSLSQMKDRIVDKLAAVPVPADALDNARQSLESIIKDVTHAAQGLTKDVVHKIKVRLAEILPFVSPLQTGKIVDDAERDVLDMSEAPSGDSLTREEKTSSEQSNKHGGHHGEARDVSAAVTSSIIFPPPSSSSSVSMGHLRKSVSLRSRM